VSNEVLNVTDVRAADLEVGGRKIIREPRVHKKTGKSRTQRWRDIRKGVFPAPVEIGPNSIGWFEDEIDEWLATRRRRTYGTAPAS
jgi:predicted DNA-binding transcriptional regulator AlpA